MDNRGTRIAIAVVLLLLLLGGTVYGWYSYSNRQRLQQMLAAAKARPMGQRPSSEEMQAWRANFESLPQSYQREFRNTMRQEFMTREYEKAAAYFKLSKEERNKALDKEIADEEARSKRREEFRKQREAERAKSGNSSNGSGGRSGSNGNGQGGNGPGGGPGGGGPGSWGGNRGLAGMLDRTTPEFRATMSAYRLEMAQRRAALGLPPRQSRRGYL